MNTVNKESGLWAYLPKDIQNLIKDGEDLITHVHSKKEEISDFSYLVFPFAKAYEGFLKCFFLDLDLIAEDDYYSNDIRIGRILNPHFINKRGNVFSKICNHPKTRKDEGRILAEQLWAIWKRGRNQVFHYFPHNYKRLKFDDAMSIIEGLVNAMEAAVSGCKLDIHSSSFRPTKAKSKISSVRQFEI